ncbi:hypothetical protein T265_07207 [Opisthorchis viverrini]|uniref:Uncharacterized protein n=1 Tax=Opisthorchis viverrini TaxID=6198 RepID=A0A074ZDT1_OPIVI|nr:hypothetical protein T265_07207 [Opisthorchis viverrini]KER25333.1 hypothetical protein T265_07207 [Opisthorchis viverrini]
MYRDISNILATEAAWCSTFSCLETSQTRVIQLGPSEMQPNQMIPETIHGILEQATILDGGKVFSSVERFQQSTCRSAAQPTRFVRQPQRNVEKQLVKPRPPGSFDHRLHKGQVTTILRQLESFINPFSDIEDHDFRWLCREETLPPVFLRQKFPLAGLWQRDAQKI